MLSAHRGRLSVTRQQLSLRRQDEDALPQRLSQLCELRRRVGVPRAVGEDRIAYEPTMSGQFQAHAAGRVPWQTVNPHPALPKPHPLTIMQLEAGWHREQIRVCGVHTDGSARSAMQLLQCADVVGVSMREQDGDQLSAGDGTQQRARIVSRIHKQGMGFTAEQDITIRVIWTYCKSQDIHVHGAGVHWLLWQSANPVDRLEKRSRVCCRL